ncbi:hypothetical protein M514_02028 [Trichuris suis]|uniref:Uncharacterized protein n=1 Tax=Trichuris suis TaxID=68888 RepID=A0A085N291_9BILA|nr:hypothetical protein M514_02028 [Trichuris suis]
MRCGGPAVKGGIPYRTIGPGFQSQLHPHWSQAVPRAGWWNNSVASQRPKASPSPTPHVWDEILKEVTFKIIT